MFIFSQLPDAQIFFWGFVFLSLPLFILASLRDAFNPGRYRVNGFAAAEPAEDLQDYGYGEPEPKEGPAVLGSPGRTEAVLPLQRAARSGAPGSQNIAVQGAFPAIRTEDLPIAGAANRLHTQPPMESSGFEASRLRQGLFAAGGSAVRFLAWSPDRVPDQSHFEILVQLEALPGLRRPIEEMPEHNAGGISAPLITNIERGARIVLVLECMPVGEGARRGERSVAIDAPYQALSWEGRPLTAIFAAKASAADGTGNANLLLWVTAGGVERGTIDFDIAIDPITAANARHDGIEPARADLRRVGGGSAANAVARATLFERVLICSAHEDRERVTALIAAIETTTLEYRADGFDLDREDDGLALVRDWVQTADIVYIVWSAAAAASPAMRKKLELIRSEQIGRKLHYRRRQSKRLAVCVVRAGECSEEPPSWLYDDGGYEKALSAFKSES